jgi:amylovoran biosynthesis glycosyltransferase AmsD
MTKKKVAIFINDMNALSGMARVVGTLARTLAVRYDVTVLTCEPLPSAPAFHAAAASYASLNLRRRWSGRIAVLADLARTGRRLRSFCKEQKIDVVLAMWFELSIAAGVALAGTGIAAIGCEHIEFDDASRMWRVLRRQSYRLLSAVVCLTHADLGKYKALNERSFVIPNSVPAPDDSAVPSRNKQFLTAGSLIPRKGIDRVIWDLSGPLRKHPDWTLIIVGGGELGHIDWNYLAHFSSLVEALDLRSQVKLFPATRDIQNFYSNASVYVMGSRSEGLPMVLLEAKRAGLPIIAYDCPTGPREIVRHGEDGFIVPDLTDLFSQYAERLITDDALRTAMGNRGKEDVARRFSEQVITAMWLELIDGVLTKQPAAAIEGRLLRAGAVATI